MLSTLSTINESQEDLTTLTFPTEIFKGGIIAFNNSDDSGHAAFGCYNKDTNAMDHVSGSESTDKYGYFTLTHTSTNARARVTKVVAKKKLQFVYMYSKLSGSDVNLPDDPTKVDIIEKTMDVGDELYLLDVMCGVMLFDVSRDDFDSLNMRTYQGSDKVAYLEYHNGTRSYQPLTNNSGTGYGTVLPSNVFKYGRGSNSSNYTYLQTNDTVKRIFFNIKCSGSSQGTYIDTYVGLGNILGSFQGNDTIVNSFLIAAKMKK